MLKRFISFVLFAQLLLITLASAQQKAFARTIVDTLASAYFGGRGYINDGVVKAAQYISTEFEKYQLLPFNGSYFQFFPVSVNTFPGEMKLKINEVQLIAGTDFLIEAMSPPDKGTYQTYTVTFNDILNEKNLQLIMQKSAGKYLVVDQRKEKPIDKAARNETNNILNFLKYSAHAPNAGTIILTNEKLTWGQAGFQAPKPVFIVNAPANVKKVQSITVTADAEMRKNFVTSNLTGYIKGCEVPDSFLVVTAHYDHLGKMGSEIVFPGANDNASGIAMLFSLARHYSNNPPKYTMVFCALSAEELGLLGARYFTENPLFELSRIKFLVNFDLAGTGNEGIKVVNATIFPNEFNKLKTLNDSLACLNPIEPRGEACISDHCMFYLKNIPCFYIYTLGGISAYHDIYDKSETLPLTAFDEYFRLMVEFFSSF
ncbi:MAG: M28 family peptidase [Bacteroidales bacterium]|nr:M28 family peptidase [Bacteroidales bacterium]